MRPNANRTGVIRRLLLLTAIALVLSAAVWQGAEADGFGGGGPPPVCSDSSSTDSTPDPSKADTLTAISGGWEGIDTWELYMVVLEVVM